MAIATAIAMAIATAIAMVVSDCSLRKLIVEWLDYIL